MPIFYKITAPNGQNSHLLGTIHHADKRLTFTSLEVKKALDNAKNCIFESDGILEPNFSTTKQEILQNLSQEWLSSEEKNSRYEEYLQKAREYKKKLLIGLDGRIEDWEENKTAVESALQSTLPILFAIELLVDYAELARQAQINASELSLDYLLIKEARKNGKPTHSLETITEQIYPFIGGGLSHSEQLDFFEFMHGLVAKKAKTLSLEKTKELYLQEKAKEISEYSFFFMQGEVPKAVKKYYAGIVSERDRNMAERMKPWLEKGAAFVAVGTEHLEGIIEKLASEGYQITAVLLSEKCYPVYEPKMSLGLFGFSPSAVNNMRLCDPEVEIEEIPAGMLAKFKDFKAFPKLKDIISFPKESTIKDSEEQLGLLKKYELDIGFFSAPPQILCSGDGIKLSEYMQKYGIHPK